MDKAKALAVALWIISTRHLIREHLREGRAVGKGAFQCHCMSKLVRAPLTTMLVLCITANPLEKGLFMPAV